MERGYTGGPGRATAAKKMRLGRCDSRRASMRMRVPTSAPQKSKGSDGGVGSRLPKSAVMAMAPRKPPARESTIARSVVPSAAESSPA